MKLPGLAYVGLGMALLLGGVYARMQHYKHLAAQGALRSDSLEAINDTTHQLLLSKDSTLVGFSHRAFQAERKADSLDKRLKLTTVALTNARLTIRGVDTVLLGDRTVTPDETTPAAHFESDTPPFHLKLDVTIPPPPDTARARFAVRLDTARIGVRTVCGQPVHGVKPASILFSTPAWLSVAIDSAQVTPLSCNSAILEMGKHRFGYYAVRGGAVAGAATAVYKALKALGIL